MLLMRQIVNNWNHRTIRVEDKVMIAFVLCLKGLFFQTGSDSSGEDVSCLTSKRMYAIKPDDRISSEENSIQFKCHWVVDMEKI